MPKSKPCPASLIATMLVLAALAPTWARAERTFTLTVFDETTDAGGRLPAVTPETPAYYFSLAGEPHKTGVLRGKNRLTAADLDDVVKRAAAVKGYQPAGKTHPPTLVIDYQWGEWLANGLPDRNLNGSNRGLVIRAIHTRAVMVGGSVFADEFRTALTDSATEAELNFQSLAGRGNPAANAMSLMSDANDPLRRFQAKSRKMPMLVDQATSDCYFVVISAHAYDPSRESAGALLWRCSMTMRTRRVSPQQAMPLMIESAAPWLGVPMAEAEILKQKAK